MFWSLKLQSLMRCTLQVTISKKHSQRDLLTHITEAQLSRGLCGPAESKLQLFIRGGEGGFACFSQSACFGKSRISACTLHEMRPNFMRCNKSVREVVIMEKYIHCLSDLLAEVPSLNDGNSVQDSHSHALPGYGSHLYE
jgi:hypothetical protein